MMSAAEVSGDVHGSYLARELKSCSLFGMGGERMKAAGVDIRLDITRTSSVGIVEAIANLPTHISTLRTLKKMLRDERPDALILIDAQGFNMILASYAKKIGIKTIYYIAPQEWLWGTKKGIDKVVRTIDLIISIFAKEHEMFKAAGGNSVYYGHPLLDIIKVKMDRSQFCRKYLLDADKKIVALCPGSRVQEMNRLLPILLDAAKKLKGVQFVLPISSSIFRSSITDHVSSSGLDIKLVEGSSYDVLGNCDLAIASSGTIILECVCLGTPVIMFYKLSAITYYISRYLFRIKLPFYSMPNLLAGRSIVPEYVMWDATSENIASEAVKLLEDPGKLKEGYREVMALLGSPGAIKKSAQKIIEFIST